MHEARPTEENDDVENNYFTAQHFDNSNDGWTE